MKSPTFAIASALIAASLASASKYNAVCVFDELKCGGSIMLREYTPDTANNCENKDCMAITAPGVTMFSALPTCTDDHVADTEKHLKGKPYVIVETYAGTGCSGDFTTAVAVVASGKCFPSIKGDTSYVVTLAASSLTVTWKQFMGGNCSTNPSEVIFPACEADRMTCIKGTTRVLAVKPMADGVATTRVPLVINEMVMNGSTTPPTPAMSSASTASSRMPLVSTSFVVLTAAHMIA